MVCHDYVNSVEGHYRLQMEGDVENVWWVPLTWSMTLTKKYESMYKQTVLKHNFSAPKMSRKLSQVTIKSC